MLSEQIAGEIAKSGGLGIREKVMSALAARAGTAPGTDDAVAAAQKVLDRTLAGANSRDAAVPLAVERQFLNITRPAPAGAVRNSITREA
jgi:Rod binding domain-containing protein